ncbi:MAG: hypothetical protein ABH877_00720 [bacterium]
MEIPGWSSAQPGQFALLKPDLSRCFLARALSIAGEVGERVSFLVSPVGEGTRELCGLREGADIWVLGPLGNGFDMERVSGSSRLLVVAGGVGAAPFPLLLSWLTVRFGSTWGKDVSTEPPASGKTSAPRAGRSPEVVVLLGFRDASQARGAGPVIEAVSRSKEAGLSCRLVMVTEDGSQGPAEKVTDVLSRELLPHDRVVVCGPRAMSVSVWGLCCTVPDVQAWFSLEAGMACGVGSCYGCALPLADGSVARVCRDGPVFSGETVFDKIRRDGP